MYGEVMELVSREAEKRGATVMTGTYRTRRALCDQVRGVVPACLDTHACP